MDGQTSSGGNGVSGRGFKKVRRGKAMKEITLTGYELEEFVKLMKRGKQPGCYQCKRQFGSQGAFVVKNGFNALPLFLKYLEFVDGNLKFKVPLCDECHRIMSWLAGKAASSQQPVMAASVN